MDRRRSAVSYQEESTLCILIVKVIEASNIPWADLMSNADCYVCLWLPTSTNKICQTKTVSNCNCPVWNETFEYVICCNVKNVIHLTLHDEDVITKNDLLYTVAFDVGNVKPGKTEQKIFRLNCDGEETLKVEFAIHEIIDDCERIMTNGVLVSREMSCLEVSVDRQRIPSNLIGRNLKLCVEDSCERERRLELKAGTDQCHSCACRFHCIKKWDPEFTARIEGSEDECLHTIPLKSLPFGQDHKIHLTPRQVYANCWGFRCYHPLHWIKEKPLEVKIKTKTCADKPNLRLGFDICDEEKQFLSKRKKVVADALKRVLKLDRDLEEHEVPVISVSATGGGIRAMTCFYGTLRALKKLNLLDCISYIAGTSGSTWSMSKLYEDPDWSQKDITETIDDARCKVTSSKLSAFSFSRLAFYKDEIQKRDEMGYRTSFSDLWGLVIEAMLCGHVNENKLSDQKKALCRGQNPLPLYLSMNVKPDENSTLDYKEWCEFSPFEVGLLKYGAFIRAEDFGSEFFMGRQTTMLPESRICFLQGVWSNVFSINLLDAWFEAVSSEHLWHRFTRDNVLDLDDEEALQRRRISDGLSTRLEQPAGDFSNIVRSVLTNRPLDGRHHNFLRGLQLHSDYFARNGFCSFDDTELDSSPNKLTPAVEDLCLVDPAYYINASFPPLLREERQVDVLMSFDYGLSDKFKSVLRTQEYCQSHKLFFPKIEVTEEDRQNPKECYVYSDCEYPEFPIILHFPLVNNTFKEYKHPGVKRETRSEEEEGQVPLSGLFSPYKVFRLTYSAEDFDKLIKLTEYNVENNVETILQAFRDAIARRQRRRSTMTD